jgi:proteic killer suppression protein
MELLFKTQMLRTICEEEARAVSMLGVEAADRLRSRLADLRAAGTVSDLVAGNPSFSGDRNSELRIRLDDEHDIFCRPNHATPPTDSAGLIDWPRVHRLQVVEIEER